MNKLQSGDLKDQQLTFDLTEVLRELNQIYDERAAKKGIRYEIDWKNIQSQHSGWKPGISWKDSVEYYGQCHKIQSGG